jgi:dienelactone hydrolase
MNPLTRRQALVSLGALALLWEHLLAQNSPAVAPAATPSGAGTPLPPDLVNLDATMQWLAGERALRLSFLDAQWRDLETWKKSARAEFRRCLSYNPKPLPLGADLVRKEERDGFNIEVITIRATPAYHIPARVLVPAKRSGRLPAVVGIHCHSGRYTWGHEKLISSSGDSPALVEMRNGTYGRPWAEALVRRGFIVIVIDGFYFGERRLRAEDLVPERVIPEAREMFNAIRKAAPDSAEWHRAVNRVCSLYEHLTAKNLISAGATWPGLHTWDDMRTVDYLLTRPDVDPQRIGAAGLSIGGLRVAHLIGADPRIKAASITGWMTQFALQHRNHLRNHTWMIFVPGLYGSMDFPDIAGLHAPGALLVQQCKRDQLYPMAAMQGAVDHLTRLYAKAGLPERFRGTFYDTPHVFQPPMQEETFDWLERWL